MTTYQSSIAWTSRCQRLGQVLESSTRMESENTWKYAYHWSRGTRGMHTHTHNCCSLWMALWLCDVSCLQGARGVQEGADRGPSTDGACHVI